MLLGFASSEWLQSSCQSYCHHFLGCEDGVLLQVTVVVAAVRLWAEDEQQFLQVSTANPTFIVSAVVASWTKHKWTIWVLIIFISLEEIIFECHCFFRYLFRCRWWKWWIWFVSSMWRDETDLDEVFCSGFKRITDDWTSLGGFFCSSFSVVGQQSWKGITRATT